MIMRPHRGGALLAFTISCLSLTMAAASPIANQTIENKLIKRAIIASHGLGGPVTIVADDVSRTRPNIDDYKKQRSAFIKREDSRAFGSAITLNDRELLANEIIMAAKRVEYENGLLKPHSFNPSKHFFKVLDSIRDSKLFKLLERMPKGGILHTHDTAICSTEFLVELTYWDNLWISRNVALDAVIFRFANQVPSIEEAGFGNWSLVATERQAQGRQAFDDDLRKRMSLFPREIYEDINEAWETFMGIFGTIDGLITYAPAWKAYYYNALKELRDDGVSYLEFRTTLPILYDLEDSKYNELDTAQMYKDTLDQFAKDFPDFIGSKMIYAPIRNVDALTVAHYIEIAIALKARFPTYFAGFDLVGQEDLGRPLIEFADQLLAMPDNIDFFFHAGETNWFGATNDENLIDAVLMGAKRIGHGYAMIKHPAVLDMVKQRDIAIEVNPISNQVLLLVDDTRNHPCSYLFANNYPVVISSDDPSFWKAKPLSHDFYIAFLGIASSHSDLKLLKQLAINSISYSALNSAEKELAFIQWQAKWADYIEWVIAQEKSTNSKNKSKLKKQKISQMKTNQIL